MYWALGCGLRASHWANLCRGLRVCRGVKPLAKLTASGECLYPTSGLCGLVFPIVQDVLCVSNVWGEGPEAIVLAGKVAVRRLLPTPSSLEPQTGFLQATRWVDVAGRSLRRTWTAHWRRQHVEV